MKCLVLAGGFPQIALINELKSRGFFVLLADYNSEPVAKKFADKYYQVSTLDVQAITDIAKEEKVDFLITAFTDQALHTVAKVSEDLGLPCYIDYKTALDVTNKAYMKKVFSENNVSTAGYVVLKELEEDKIAHLRYPLIVKPVDCNSSKGVKKVENYEELYLAFKEAVNFSRTDTAVIEEFIEGTEISVDVYVENGVAKVLAASRLEKLSDNDKFIIFRSYYNYEEYTDIMEKIEETAQKIADSFNLKNSPMLIQMITDGKEVYVLEFSARTGGGVKYLHIKNASGFDVTKAVVDLTLGIKPSCEKKMGYKYIVNDFIYCYPGIFDHLEGFEELKQEKVIQDFYLFKWKGADFDEIKSSGDRIAGYTVCADSLEELLRKHKKVNSCVKVIDVNGRDMMRHDIITDISF